MSESSQDSKDSKITSMKTQELQTPQSDYKLICDQYQFSSVRYLDLHCIALSVNTPLFTSHVLIIVGY